MADDDLIPCVGGVILDGAGRILLVRRGHPPGMGQWSIPGGRVEPGETDEAAVVREVAEETGLTVSVDRPVGTVRRAAPGGGTFVINDYVVRPIGDPVPDPVAGDDAADARWVTRAELAALPLVDGLVEALAAWVVLPS